MLTFDTNKAVLPAPAPAHGFRVVPTRVPVGLFREPKPTDPDAGAVRPTIPTRVIWLLFYGFGSGHWRTFPELHDCSGLTFGNVREGLKFLRAQGWVRVRSKEGRGIEYQCCAPGPYKEVWIPADPHALKGAQLTIFAVAQVTYFRWGTVSKFCRALNRVARQHLRARRDELVEMGWAILDRHRLVRPNPKVLWRKLRRTEWRKSMRKAVKVAFETTEKLFKKVIEDTPSATGITRKDYSAAYDEWVEERGPFGNKSPLETLPAPRVAAIIASRYAQLYKHHVGFNTRITQKHIKGFETLIKWADNPTNPDPIEGTKETFSWARNTFGGRAAVLLAVEAMFQLKEGQADRLAGVEGGKERWLKPHERFLHLQALPNIKYVYDLKGNDRYEGRFLWTALGCLDKVARLGQASVQQFYDMMHHLVYAHAPGAPSIVDPETCKGQEYAFGHGKVHRKHRSYLVGVITKREVKAYFAQELAQARAAGESLKKFTEMNPSVRAWIMARAHIIADRFADGKGDLVEGWMKAEWPEPDFTGLTLA